MLHRRRGYTSTNAGANEWRGGKHGFYARSDDEQKLSASYATLGVACAGRRGVRYISQRRSEEVPSSCRLQYWFALVFDIAHFSSFTFIPTPRGGCYFL